MNRNKVIIGLVLVSVLSALLIFSFVARGKKVIEDTSTSNSVSSINSEELKNSIYATATPVEEKIEIVKTLKEISTNEAIDPKERVLAGQTVVSTFFDFGTTLSAGFSENGFSEREIYEYSKYINTLGDSDRNTLLTAYIGLRFYSDEINEDFILELLRSNLRYVNEFGSDNMCGQRNKVSSILYMSQKEGYSNVIKEFGNYNESFKFAFSSCPSQKRDTVAFMWLAALSDIGTSDEEVAIAEKLVEFITTNANSTSSLVMNLKQSYFVENPEPDTQSIVERLVTKYPDFKMFIETIRNS